MNYRWPENKRTGRVPWFVVLRRGLFVIPTAVVTLILFLLVLAGWGYQEAKQVWRN